MRSAYPAVTLVTGLQVLLATWQTAFSLLSNFCALRESTPMNKRNPLHVIDLPSFLVPLVVLALLACPAHAAEPPTTPILRLETGLHTAPIIRIATDAQGRRLATVSHDKTARV